MDLLLIDAIAPFFRNIKSKRINWSKIPFSQFEHTGGLEEQNREQLIADFSEFVAKAALAGYTAITLDDLAHLCPYEGYPQALLDKITIYRKLYARLFEIAAAHNLQVFITSDLMFYNDVLLPELGRSVKRITSWLQGRVAEFLADFPQVAGVVFRFGEADGAGVVDDFQSRLVLRSPAQVRYLIKQMLPVFENTGRQLIFRTWSIGAYRTGDLLWNPQTFDKAFKGIVSDNLIISIKYGESDFFRYLRTNPLFFHSNHKKIVEFQARREYEGFGVFPSFVGYDCQKHMDNLKDAKNIVGASVWVQTGGWGKSRRLTFVRKSPIWVELNIHVISAICRGRSADEAVADFCKQFLPGVEPRKMSEFLQLSEQVIGNLLYVREFAQRQLFFRRLRLPPTLFVFWDRIMISSDIGKIMSCLVVDKKRCLREGREAFAALDKMIALAREAGIPDEGLEYQLDTFEILLAAREYYFGEDKDVAGEKLIELKEAYCGKYSRRYSVRLDFTPSRLSEFALRRAVGILLRKKAGYRLVDRFFLLRGLSLLYPLLKYWKRALIPNFTRKHTMGVDTFFK